MPKKANNDEPKEGEIVEEKNEQAPRGKRNGRIFLGLILVLIGGLFIMENFFPGLNLQENFFPIVLIAIGLAFVAGSFGY